jgi:hypothetical protein
MMSHRTRVRLFTRALRRGSPRLTPHHPKLPPARFVAMLVVMLVGIFGWSLWGGQIMAELNPMIRTHFHMLTPTLNAWITPPVFTHQAPIMIATPVGARLDKRVITVPVGSILTAHLADHDGDVPELIVNGETVAFTPDTSGGYAVSHEVLSGDKISIHRGWQDIATWKIDVQNPLPPHIAFTDAPTISESRATRIAYMASDDFGVTSVVARLTPRTSPGVNNVPIDIPLAMPNSKTVQRISFEDLTGYAWAGQPVQIQLIVTNAAGLTAASDAQEFVSPGRHFANPIAQALIDERLKLLDRPDDEVVRNQTANIMAGIARTPPTYQGDHVVLMALRAGAVRLILDHGRSDILAITDLLWQSAIRIESGAVGVAEQRLHEAQRALADALDRRSDGRDVQELVERLRVALAEYLTTLSARTVPAPESVGDLKQALGVQMNQLTPEDINRSLEKIRDLSNSGSADAARDVFVGLQQQLEAIRGNSISFSDAVRKKGSEEGAHNLIDRLLKNF